VNGRGDVAAGRVARVDLPEGGHVAVGYNARGLRSRLAVYARAAAQPTYTESFTYRGDRVGAVAVDGAHPFVETFVYRPDGTPLELLYREPSKATQRYWYVVDGQGSVVGLTDASGQVVNQYAYDPWGAGYNASYPEEATQEAVLQPLRYRGYWDDAWYGGDANGAVQGALVQGAQRARVRSTLRAALGHAAPLTFVKAPARPVTLGDLPSALAPQLDATAAAADAASARTTARGQRGTAARTLASGSPASDQGPLPWYRLRMRYYDPLLRRFLQPDPSALDGVRSYVYCHNNPADCADPTGLAGGLGDAGDPIGVPFEGEASGGGGTVGGEMSLRGALIGSMPTGAETIAAVSQELGSEPYATLDLLDGWQKNIPDTKYGDKFVYMLADMGIDGESDMVLKAGKTSGTSDRLFARFKAYARAGRNLQLRLRLTIWKVEPGPSENTHSLEGRVRSTLLDLGHTLPWDNNAAERLGRPGAGTPYENSVSASNNGWEWVNDPSSAYHGQLYDRPNDSYFTQNPPYYPTWKPEPSD